MNAAFETQAGLRGVRAALWLYFWLLLFEGVLRKWVLPEFSDVLFVIRDPVAIAAYVLAWRAGVLPWRPALVALWALAVLSILFSFAGETLWLVTLFGLRTNFLHLPLVFVMAATLDRADVRRFGRAFLWCAMPVTVLMLAQFTAERDSWINVGAGGKVSAQINGALGRIRPPGPFSFVTGVVSFFTLTAAFMIDGWLERVMVPRLLRGVATLALIVALPISISRALVISSALVGVFALTALLHKRQRAPLLFAVAATGAGLLAFMFETIYVQAFITRWDEAQMASRGSFYANVVERIIGEFTEPLRIAAEVPLLGHGIGLGTVAGARLTSGQYSFLLAESELPRLVLELGPLLGFAFIAWRWWLAGMLVWRGWRSFRDEGDALAWLLAGATVLPILIGQWGPATSLGFAVFGAGLTLAALNPPANPNTEPDSEPSAADGEEGQTPL
jgi:hypothetical protein